MQKVILYTYKDGNSTIVTPNEPTDREYTVSAYVRLVADEGMELTDGEMVTAVIDTTEPDAWQEVETSKYDEDLYDGLTAEQIEYIKAGKILMGE